MLEWRYRLNKILLILVLLILLQLLLLLLLLLLVLEGARASTGLCVDVSSGVKRDDGRRSSNDPTRSHHNDGRRLDAHSTRRPTTVEADSPSGGYFKQMPNK